MMPPTPYPVSLCARVGALSFRMSRPLSLCGPIRQLSALSRRHRQNLRLQPVLYIFMMKHF